MRFNPEWHELFDELGGVKHLAEFMPAKLRDNAAIDRLIDISGDEVEVFCGSEADGVRLIEIVDMVMCVAYVAGYKAAQADLAAEKEFEETCRNAKK